MKLKTGFNFPDDFMPDWKGKTKYIIPMLGADRLFDGNAPSDIMPEHYLPRLLRRQLMRYDLRNPGDRAEWTALLIQLIMAEGDETDIITVSDKIAKLLKELNNSSDIERVMERLETLYDIKEDIERRMGIEARVRATASENATSLALEIHPEEATTDVTPS